MVDERDFQLLAHLLKEPLASNEELGRRVRLSGTAVKTRLEGLTEEGVFGGLYGIPAPEVFQRRRHVYVFRGERVNATAPHKAIQIDPVVSVHLRQDGNLPAIVYEPPGEATDPPEELVRTFGEPAFSVLPRPFQAPLKGAVLSPIDWRVMRPLIREPRMTRGPDVRPLHRRLPGIATPRTRTYAFPLPRGTSTAPPSPTRISAPSLRSRITSTRTTTASAVKALPD